MNLWWLDAAGSVAVQFVIWATHAYNEHEGWCEADRLAKVEQWYDGEYAVPRPVPTIWDRIQAYYDGMIQ